MDDLSGLDWSASSKPTTTKAPVTGTGNYYTSLRPNPPAAGSGTSTPLSAQGSGNFKLPTAAPKASAADSFSNLVSFGSSKQNTLTLQEQQEKLQAEKAKKEAEKRKQYELQFGQTQHWEGLGSKSHTPSFTPPITSRSSTPAAKVLSPSLSNFSGGSSGAGISPATDNDDLFAAFNKDTKVDNSSHYPPPPQQQSRQNTPLQPQTLDLSTPEAWNSSGGASGFENLGDDDDDPFGLGQMGTRTTAPAPEPSQIDDTDDFLGDLGKPVEEVKRQAKPKPSPQPVAEESNDRPQSDDPWDKAVAELVDMGFSAENSRRALTESGSGLNVQAAVGWLLNDAHRQAKEKASGKSTPDPRGERSGASRNGSRREESADVSRRDAVPAWMREGRDQSQPRRDDSRSPANGDDLSRTAAAVGSNLLKTANSLWKTSQKKVQKAVSEFQQEGGDPSQPKWMRGAVPDNQYPPEKQSRPESGRDRGRQEASTSSAPSVTDEALMLEGDSRPPPRRTKPSADPRFLATGTPSSRDQSPASSNPSTGRSTPVPRWQQSTPAAPLDPRSRLNKQAVEEQSAQAYISPSRRKKATPTPKAAEEPDLLFSDSSVRSSQPASHMPPRQAQTNTRPAPAKSPLSSKPSTPIQVRPKAPTRNIPSLSPSALASSTQHRLAGTAHFKRGDYASAHTSYSTSLSSLPQGHPITIILLCNRSLTALKTGDPKASVADADTALALIGPSRGESETIDLHSDGTKDMKEFWGKALTRKAEALEQMERWKDAGAVWQQAIEAGVGGATAVQGRQRCENALKPKPAVSRPAPKAAPKPKPRSAMSDLAPASTQSTEAVNRLRAANAAAEKADDEKFALSDSVDARIMKWREGRRDNLRALLGGLDAVLWEGSGWKKVGMHELVMNGKVKIVYMKAIAKVHPDKLPQDAGTEVKMISASVFATLNEAWDKFKTDNGM